MAKKTTKKKTKKSTGVKKTLKKMRTATTSDNKVRDAKVTIGAPTKYQPEYCEMLIEHMEQGLSFESFAAIVHTSSGTLFEWCKKHERFLWARKEGTEKCRLFYEKLGLEGMWASKEFDADGNLISDKKLNTTNWIFQMKNRFNWRDKTEVSSEKEKPFVIAYKTKSEREDSEE